MIYQYIAEAGELAGVKNVVAKIMGTNNKVSNVNATLKALSSLKKIKEEKIDNQEDKQ